MKETKEVNVMNLIKRYNRMNTKKLKFNLQKACAQKYTKLGGRKGMAKMLKMNVNSFSTCLNPAQESIVTFENLINICTTLELDVSKILNNNVIITKSLKGNHKTWTDEKMLQFVKYHKLNGLEETAKEYNLTIKTTMLYYNRFLKYTS